MSLTSFPSATTDSVRSRMLDNLRTNERTMPLYQIMAHCLDAMANRNPITVAADVWHERWKTVLRQCVNLLPQGSGFDVHPKLVESITKPDYLVFIGAYHPMDEHGGYMAWRDYRVIVKPSFLHGLTLAVAQANGDLREFIAESFHAHLTTPYDLNKLLLGVVSNECDSVGDQSA